MCGREIRDISGARIKEEFCTTICTHTELKWNRTYGDCFCIAPSDTWKTISHKLLLLMGLCSHSLILHIFECTCSLLALYTQRQKRQRANSKFNPVGSVPWNKVSDYTFACPYFFFSNSDDNVLEYGFIRNTEMNCALLALALLALCTCISNVSSP